MKTNWGSHATLILSLRSKSLELYYETPKATTHLRGNNQTVQALPIKFPSSYLTILPALFLMLCYTWLSSSSFIPASQTLRVTALFVLQCCQQSSNPRVGHSFVFELVPPCLTVWKIQGPKQKAEKEMVVFFMFNRKKACEGTVGAQRQNNGRKSHSPFLFSRKKPVQPAAECSSTSTAGSTATLFQPSVSLRHRTWQQLTGSATGSRAKEHRAYVFCAQVWHVHIHA